MKHIAVFAIFLASNTSFACAQQGNPGAHFLENWDLDGNGQVTIAEAEERRGDVFMSFDADDDGVLSAEEYSFFDEARANDMQQNAGAHGLGKGQGQGGMLNAEAGMRMAVNDTDANGSVSRAEFLSRTAAWLQQMDRNGDGVVTVKDFGRN